MSVKREKRPASIFLKTLKLTTASKLGEIPKILCDLHFQRNRPNILTAILVYIMKYALKGHKTISEQEEKI